VHQAGAPNAALSRPRAPLPSAGTTMTMDVIVEKKTALGMVTSRWSQSLARRVLNAPRIAITSARHFASSAIAPSVFRKERLVAEQGLRRTTALTNLLLQQLNDRKYNQAESTAHMTLFGLTQ